MTEPAGLPPGPPAGPAWEGPGYVPPWRSASRTASRAVSRAASAGAGRLTVLLGGPARTRVIVVLACVLALASADAATVGASATELRQALHIDNTDIGLLVAVNSLVGALASVPFGILADRVRRTWTLGAAVTLWGAAMLASATAHSFSGLLWWRLWLGVVTAAAGPPVASLVGDYFPSAERGRIYSYILTGELVGAGAGFAVTGDIAAISWRAAFFILGLAAFPLALALFRLREPARGGAGVLVREGAAPDTAATDTDATDTAATDTAATDTGATDGAATGTQAAAGPGGAGDGAAPGAEGAAEDAPQGDTVTDAQRLAAERGITADAALLSRIRRGRMGLVSATRYVLAVRTNMALILSGACGYYFLAGVQTFGVEFVRGQYHVNVALANLLMLVIGGGAAIGVMVAGPLSDAMLRRGRLRARVLVSAVAVSVAVVLFIPALITHSIFTALPYVIFAAAGLSAQNPPIDAARLDIMPARLWGRAEGVRTFLRTIAQALAPLLFGFFSGYIGLRWTFVMMLAPLSLSAYYLFRALGTYPSDVATAAAASDVMA